MKTKPRKAWAIVDSWGNIQLDKVMASQAEAWGLLLGEELTRVAGIRDLKANGYRCVRVEIKSVSS